MLNKVMLIGHLTADPEAKFTNTGSQVTNFSVATNEVWYDANGAKQERAEFHRIVAFGKLAEICAKYLNKGKLIYLEGRLQTRQWEDRDGIKRYTTEIVAQQMKMIGGERRQEPETPGPLNGYGTRGKTNTAGGASQDDDLPF